MVTELSAPALPHLLPVLFCFYVCSPALTPPPPLLVSSQISVNSCLCAPLLLFPHHSTCLYLLTILIPFAPAYLPPLWLFLPTPYYLLYPFSPVPPPFQALIPSPPQASAPAPLPCISSSPLHPSFSPLKCSNESASSFSFFLTGSQEGAQ